MLTAPGASAAGTLQGAGSTLVAPIEAEWATAWATSTGNPTPVYHAVGLGAGLTEIGQGLVDFDGSDVPLSASTTPCSGCVQIPWALSATSISFNIPGVHRLRLTGPVLAKIYLGQITNWDDRRIRALNRGIAHLPKLRITPIHRSDGSGDSYAFSDYLSSVSRAWEHSKHGGRSTRPAFAVGPGAEGNGGVDSLLKRTRGGIAYIAVAYQMAKKQPEAAIKNAAGNYELPKLRNISNAAGSIVHNLPSDNEEDIVDPPRRARIAYPISAFTYAILRSTDPSGNGSELASFLRYAVGPGQKFAEGLDLVPLPRFIRQRDLATLNSVH